MSESDDFDVSASAMASRAAQPVMPVQENSRNMSAESELAEVESAEVELAEVESAEVESAEVESAEVELAEGELAEGELADRTATDTVSDFDETIAVEDMGIDVHLDENGQPRIVERHFRVEEHDAGFRLDHYLKRQIPRLSRTKIQRIIRTQLLPVRGQVLAPSARVRVGDKIVIRRPARPEPPCPRGFEILYDDGAMMVIDKPAGLPVHASARYYFNTLTRVIAERFPDRALQICHRLDRETSGALVLAQGRAMAARLKGAFADKRVQKIYLAVVWGNPPWPDHGGDDCGVVDDRALGDGSGAGDHDIDMPLGLVKDAAARIRIRMVVRADGQPSLTRVRVLVRRPHAALVQCTPVTGRQHQIRAHLAACGYPIVGDKLYAHGDDVFAAYCDHGMSDDLRARLILPRQALHAAAVTVPHPVSAQPVRVDSPLPADLHDFLERRDIAMPALAVPRDILATVC